MAPIYRGDDAEQGAKVSVELLSPQDRYNGRNPGAAPPHGHGARSHSSGGGSAWSRAMGMAWWKKALIGTVSLLLVVLVTMFIVVMVRTYTVGPPPNRRLELYQQVQLISDGKEMERARRLADALKIPTVSKQNPVQEDEQFIFKFHQFVRQRFPKVHTASWIKLELINGKSLFYTITGSVPGKLPFMFTSHFDVVPANKDSWIVDPFSGSIINDTYIYGRGAMDDKLGVIGTLEALEYMASRGEQPKRSFYCGFGHDEELAGKEGAAFIAKTLRSRGIKLDFILDEGQPITQNVFPGTDKMIAMIGVSEKGSLTIELTAKGTPGHSSIPPWETAIVNMADAVSKLEKHKLPSRLGKGPERYTFEYLAPHVSFGYRMLFTNMWLFGPAMVASMEKSPETNAMLRTTTAVTIFNGGTKSNVVPDLAKATVNHRIHSTQSVEEVLEFDRKTIDDDRIEIVNKLSRTPHPVSPFGPDDLPYQNIAAAVEQAFPGVIVVPGVLIGNTDMTHYLDFSTNIFRFIPIVCGPEDIAGFHGNNERIKIQDYAGAVSFYYRVIINSGENLDKVPDL